MSKEFVEWSDIDFNFEKSLGGEIVIATAEDAINQSIKILLSTMKGEHVRSEIGSGLYNILFKPMNEESAEEIKRVIETNIGRYENRVILERVRVVPDFETNYYTIEIKYSMLPSRKKKSLTTYAPAMGVL